MQRSSPRLSGLPDFPSRRVQIPPVLWRSWHPYCDKYDAPAVQAQHYTSWMFAFSGLILLAGRQEGHLTYNIIFLLQSQNVLPKRSVGLPMTSTRVTLLTLFSLRSTCEIWSLNLIPCMRNFSAPKNMDPQDLILKICLSLVIGKIPKTFGAVAPPSGVGGRPVDPQKLSPLLVWSLYKICIVKQYVCM